MKYRITHTRTAALRLCFWAGMRKFCRSDLARYWFHASIWKITKNALNQDLTVLYLNGPAPCSYSYTAQVIPNLSLNFEVLSYQIGYAYRLKSKVCMSAVLGNSPTQRKSAWEEDLTKGWSREGGVSSRASCSMFRGTMWSCCTFRGSWWSLSCWTCRGSWCWRFLTWCSWSTTTWPWRFSIWPCNEFSGVSTWLWPGCCRGSVSSGGGVSTAG